MKGDTLFYFNLHRIYDDGSMDIHTEELPPDHEMEPEARNLNNGIYDLPGGTGIWHGYVLAPNKGAAIVRVKTAY